MPGCLNEVCSALYIALTGRFLSRADERMDETQEQLERLVTNLDARGAVLCTQQVALMAELRTMAPGERRKTKFQEYKRVGMQRERLLAYKDMVLTHLDALSNSELNKTLISTLQESAKTLKAMGAVDGVRQAELVVADVETSMMQVQELTQVLGQPLQLDSGTHDLEAELEEMLQREDMEDKMKLRVKEAEKPDTFEKTTLPAVGSTLGHGSSTRQRVNVNPVAAAEGP